MVINIKHDNCIFFNHFTRLFHAELAEKDDFKSKMANLKHANGRYESHLIPHSIKHLKDNDL